MKGVKQITRLQRRNPIVLETALRFAIQGIKGARRTLRGKDARIGSLFFPTIFLAILDLELSNSSTNKNVHFNLLKSGTFIPQSLPETARTQRYNT